MEPEPFGDNRLGEASQLGGAEGTQGRCYADLQNASASADSGENPGNLFGGCGGFLLVDPLLYSACTSGEAACLRWGHRMEAPSLTARRFYLSSLLSLRRKRASLRLV